MLTIPLIQQLSGEIPNPTPLQEKPNDLAELIAKIGGSAGLVSVSLIVPAFALTGFIVLQTRKASPSPAY